MTTQWYYMAQSWWRKPHRIGPIEEAALLERIDRGHIQPQTLLMSSKTRQRWIEMRSVPPAMARWKSLQAKTKVEHQKRPEIL